MYPDKEHIFGAASTIFKPSQVKIENSQFEAFLFNFELRDCIMMCNNTMEPLSPCVQKFYDDKYGKHFINSTKKLDDLMELKISGKHTRLILKLKKLGRKLTST